LTLFGKRVDANGVKTKNALMVSLVITLLAAGNLMAGGDKVRGDGGQGTVTQVQVQPPWWAVVLSLVSK
jgi:hypothetical protein